MCAYKLAAAPDGKADSAFERVFWTSNLREIVDDLIDAVRTGGGVSVVTGEVGSGKTTLIRLLTTQLPRERRVVHLPLCRFGQEGPLPWILNAMDLPPDADPAARIAAVVADTARAGGRTAIVLDEAQAIPSEQLPALAELVQALGSGARLILVGQPELATKLRRGDGKALSAQVRARHVLRPLNRADTAAFLRQKLEPFGRPLDEAIDPVHRACRGSPRLIARLAEAMAVVLGAADEERPIDGALVAEAVTVSNGLGVFTADGRREPVRSDSAGELARRLCAPGTAARPVSYEHLRPARPRRLPLAAGEPAAPDAPAPAPAPRPAEPERRHIRPRRSGRLPPSLPPAFEPIDDALEPASPLVGEIEFYEPDPSTAYPLDFRAHIERFRERRNLPKLPEPAAPGSLRTERPDNLDVSGLRESLGWLCILAVGLSVLSYWAHDRLTGQPRAYLVGAVHMAEDLPQTPLPHRAPPPAVRPAAAELP